MKGYKGYNLYRPLMTEVTVTMKEFEQLRREIGVPYFHIMAKQPVWVALFDQVMETRPSVDERHEGYTPLGIAINHRNLDLARRLVSAGASLLMLSNGNALIHVALRSNVYYGGSTSIYDVVKYVLELRPSDVNLSSSSNLSRTPLQIALECNYPFKVVQLLLEHGANPNARYIDSFDPTQRVSILCDMCDTDTAAMTDSRVKLARLVVAYGGRYTDREKNAVRPRRGDCIIAAVDQCRSVARAVLGLKKCRARVHGNGRDVLRLIAKRVWLSRMDEGWS